MIMENEDIVTAAALQRAYNQGLREGMQRFTGAIAVSFTGGLLSRLPAG